MRSLIALLFLCGCSCFDADAYHGDDDCNIPIINIKIPIQEPDFYAC